MTLPCLELWCHSLSECVVFRPLRSSSGILWSFWCHNNIRFCYKNNLTRHDAIIKLTSTLQQPPRHWQQFKCQFGKRTRTTNSLESPYQIEPTNRTLRVICHSNFFELKIIIKKTLILLLTSRCISTGNIFFVLFSLSPPTIDFCGKTSANFESRAVAYPRLMSRQRN